MEGNSTVVNPDESFWVVIPHHVLSNKNLTSAEKLMYGEISSLTRKNGICYAHNKHFIEVLGLTEKTITKGIKNLENEGLISSVITHEREGVKGTYRNIILGGVVNFTTRGSKKWGDKIEIHKRSITNSNSSVVSSTDSTDTTREKINSLGKVKFTYENIEWVKSKLQNIYPVQLRGFSDPKALRSLWVMSQPRKGKDTWMDPDPKKNIAKFISGYVGGREEKYCVRDMFKLNQELRDWRERGGTFN